MQLFLDPLRHLIFRRKMESLQFSARTRTTDSHFHSTGLDRRGMVSRLLPDRTNRIIWAASLVPQMRFLECLTPADRRFSTRPISVEAAEQREAAMALPRSQWTPSETYT